MPRWRVGQNLYQSYTGKAHTGTDWPAALTAWFYSEISIFPTSSVTSYRFSERTGHYSQVGYPRKAGFYIACVVVPV